MFHADHRTDVKRRPRRPSGGSVSAAYEEFYGCERKIRYASEAEANAGCHWAATPDSIPEPYECGRCGAWHIGRSRSQAKAEYRLRWALGNPHVAPVRRLDPTLYDAIGPRAYGCGKAESFRTPSHRLAEIARRVKAAQKIASRAASSPLNTGD